MTKYDIDSLIKTFEDHYRKSKVYDEKIKKDFQKNYPDQPLPEHMNYDFNINLALKSMCEEIKALKDD